nr:hypothetical protein CPGR_01278 [Mycolicibacter nonchromogenicus]
MHEVAALAHPVGRLQQTAEHEETDHPARALHQARPRAHTGRDRPAWPVAHRGARPQCRTERHQQHRRHPQRIRGVEVGQVDQALRPLVAGRILGQCGARHQQRVVAHPEDLVRHRQGTAGDQDQQARPPLPRRDQQHDQRAAADQRQFGADQHAAAGHEGQGRGEDRSAGPGSGHPQCLRPADQHPPQQAQVGQHQPGL